MIVVMKPGSTQKQIDHIVVRGLTVEEVWAGAARVSDHLPLLAELR